MLTPNNSSAPADSLAAPTAADQTLMPGPGAVAPAPAEIEMPVAEGPNLYGDDAPPVLPPALAAGGGVAVGPAVRPAAAAAPVIQQPTSVQPVMIDDQVIIDDRVEPASAQEPLGIQLINPAGALVDPNAQGLQQAIYFEASDQ
jgi:hypothetical protein